MVNKCNFCHYLFSLKIRVEVGLNNVLDRKNLEIVLTDFVEKSETFFDYRYRMLKSPENRIFPVGLTEALAFFDQNHGLTPFEKWDT